MILDSVTIDMDFDEAVGAVKAALAEQGFGTLTEIDLSGTLHAKIGKEIDPYVIVGACNPRLAGRAVDIEPRIGALLPCNVVVRQTDDGVAVEPMDPGLMSEITGAPEIGPIAEEAEQLLRAALDTLR